EPEKGFAYIWNGRSWDAVPDYRGMTAYIKESGAGVTVRDIGELAETLTLIKPLTPFDKWDGSEWVTDIEAQRIASIADTEREKLRLKAVADDEVSWRQDAVDAGIAMAEETAALSEWKKYRVMLMRIDTTKPVWPTPPGEQAS
ncbi:TPA: tail fiber assembly protein, partial [Citrobacter freundii]|nr:tail fiber assembly protein [Citrobacter freundii]